MDETRDEDGFPLATEANAGTLYTDEFEVTWVCVFIDHPEVMDWAWVIVGKSGR